MIKVIVSILLVIVATHTVNGLSGGAPSQACLTLTPQHGINIPRIGPSPHIVNLSSFDSMFDESMNTTRFYYAPNTMYSISLVATGIGPFSDIFRGFLLQGRAYADDGIVGTFMAPPSDALYRLSSCQPNNGGVTHNSGAGKTNITVYWMSPPSGTGPIYFGHAFVWSFNTFWANLRTAPLLEAGGPNEITATAEVTPTLNIIEATPTAVMTAPPVEATATPPMVTATPTVVVVTPPVEVTATPPAVTVPPPVVIATPTEDITTPTEDVTTPTEDIATPPEIITTATPGVEDIEVTGGTTGLTISTVMMSLAVTLTIFSNIIS